MQRYGDRLLSYSEDQYAGAAVEPMEVDTSKPVAEAVQAGDTVENSSVQQLSASSAAESSQQFASTQSEAHDQTQAAAAPPSTGQPMPQTVENGNSAEPHATTSDSTAPAVRDAPPPSTTSNQPVAVAPKGKERDKAVEFADSNGGLKSGLRDWVRTGGDDVMGSAISGRITSPMREVSNGIAI